MVVYIIALLISAGYLSIYAVHCFKRRRTLPGVCAMGLMLLPVACAAIFVCILLQAL